MLEFRKLDILIALETLETLVRPRDRCDPSFFFSVEFTFYICGGLENGRRDGQRQLLYSRTAEEHQSSLEIIALLQ